MAQVAHGFRHGPQLRPEHSWWPVVHQKTNLSLCFIESPRCPARIAHSSNNKTSADSDKTIASQFHHIVFRRGSRTMPSPGLFEVQQHRRPDDTLQSPPTLQPEDCWLYEKKEAATEKMFCRGVEERELRERIRSISDFQLHDHRRWI